MAVAAILGDLVVWIPSPIVLDDVVVWSALPPGILTVSTDAIVGVRPLPITEGTPRAHLALSAEIACSPTLKAARIIGRAITRV